MVPKDVVFWLICFHISCAWERESDLVSLVPWQLCWGWPLGNSRLTRPSEAVPCRYWFFTTVFSWSPHTSRQQDRDLNREIERVYSLAWGEALSQEDDALSEILPTPQLLGCTSPSESPQKQLTGSARPTLSRVSLASTAAMPWGSMLCLLLHQHSAGDMDGHQAPAPEMPAFVSSPLGAALKPRSQISPGVTPKQRLVWKIGHNFFLVKCVRILLWICCVKEKFIAGGKAFGEFHEFVELRELFSVHQLCPPTQIPEENSEEEEWLSQSCQTHARKPGRKKGKKRVGEAVWQDALWEADPTAEQK